MLTLLIAALLLRTADAARSQGERVMLRIFIHDQVPMTSFVLQGKLIGPWVKELEKYWDWAQGTRASKPMLVDLADVSFIDSDGRALLTRMREKGARLLSAGVLINAIVDEIDAEQGKPRPGRQCEPVIENDAVCGADEVNPKGAINA